MTETVFEKMHEACSALKLEFSTEEFANYVEGHSLTEESIAAIQEVFALKNSRPPYRHC